MEDKVDNYSVTVNTGEFSIEVLCMVLDTTFFKKDVN